MCAPDCFRFFIFVCVLSDGLPWTCKTIFMCTSAAYIVLCIEFFFPSTLLYCVTNMREHYVNFHQMVWHTLLLQSRILCTENYAYIHPFVQTCPLCTQWWLVTLWIRLSVPSICPPIYAILKVNFRTAEVKTCLTWLFFPLSIFLYAALCSTCTELATTVVTIFISISICAIATLVF